MKKLKKIITSIFVIMLLLQMPIITKASSMDITQKLNESLANGNINTYSISTEDANVLRWKVQQKTITRKGVKDAKIICYITRTSGDTAINLSLTVEGDYTIDAAIFNAGTNEIMGIAKHLKPNQLNSVNWSSYELGSEKKVYLFLANYRQVTEYVFGTITY